MTPELLQKIRDALLPEWEDIPELADERRLGITQDGVYRIYVSAPAPYSVFLNDKPISTIMALDPEKRPLVTSLIQVFRKGDVVRLPAKGIFQVLWERPIPW